jgi:hypothetical protein
MIMYRSDRFEREFHRILKEHNHDMNAPQVGTRAERLFASHLRGYPSPFVSELFAYALDRVEQGTAEVSLFGVIIDLLWRDYDDQGDPLSSQDWEFLRDLVDEYAGDLDMAAIQYIMERVVSHGAI